MAYSNLSKFKKLLAQTLTSATDASLTTPTALIKIGQELDKNLIPEDIVNQYITWADEEVNGAISVLYRTPLTEKTDFETTLAADIDEYNSVIVTKTANPFAVGDTIVLADVLGTEKHVVSEILSDTSFSTEDFVQADFNAVDTRVIRIKFPDPIPLIATRLAVANLFDKYFSAQSDPNISQYGKIQRELASNLLNDILNGRTDLHGSPRIGMPFVSPYLKRRYGLDGNDRYGERNREGKTS